MTKKTNRTCPNCGSELSPSELTECDRCGQALTSAKLTGQLPTDSSLLSPTIPTPGTSPTISQVGAGLHSNPQQSRKRRWLVPLLVILALAVILPLSAVRIWTQTHPNTPATSLPQPASSMMHVSIKLIDVFCDSKEDSFWTHDQFYAMTTFTTPGQNAQAPLNIQAQISHSLDITSGQDLPIPPNSLTIFDGAIAKNSIIKGGITAYNDTQGLAWANLDSWIADVAQLVETGLTNQGIHTADVGTVTAESVLDLAVKAWYITANLSNDNANQLGTLELSVPATGAASEYGVAHFHNNGSLFGSGGWDYTLKYEILRSPATGSSIPSIGEA